MQIKVINTGFFKLDGGAMYGVVPKSIWHKHNKADEHNLCTWAMRCMLVEDKGRVVLIDTGIGNKQSEQFFSHYHLHGQDSLLNSIKHAGFSPEDITDVFFTHLHFDHCGGAVVWNAEKTGYELLFKEATHWSHSKHWLWATQPNSREKASFLKENIEPIEQSGKLKFVDQDDFDVFDYILVNGHTEAQMLPKISYNGRTVVYVADLLPSCSHIPIPYVMGYDTRPLITLDEKLQFLTQAAKEGYILFFEHDPNIECCTLKLGERRPQVDKIFKFNTWL